MITRFAPSPTGHLHLGHAYAAIFAYELAMENSGRFLLRFEDIDVTRVRSRYYLAIEQDLAWLGIHWDGVAIKQTDRLPAYIESLNKLKSLDVVYPCFCTRREIQQELKSIAHAPHDAGEEAIYPGTCRDLSPTERADRIGKGAAHCLRLNVRLASELAGPLMFEDKMKGLIDVDPLLLGDVVLARKDIATSYHLAVVTDDDFQEVTDVTRGEDLLSSTHVHRLLQHLLNMAAPVYHHHRLIVDKAGKRLAKRDADLSLATLRQQGRKSGDILEMLCDSLNN
ncbi:MAG: tRNA glutamyl-Q(34) synthetase GluQRS [Akkermansiaceae bacterium]|nr:tRNA glutamyl-Q(34) synthetase GluQRS [Akkermansiaceae bacterium]